MKAGKVKTRGLIVALLGLVVISSSAEARRQKMIDPNPVEWGCSLNMKQVKKGITMSLMSRSWTSQEVRPGYIEASVVVRGKHTLEVDVHYSRNSFDIDYKGSDNLNYSIKNGVEHIHPNANSWMQNLNIDIMNYLGGMCP